MVIGVWIDVDTNEFRARIVRTGPDGGTDERVSYAASPEDVTELLANWLNEFVG